MHVEAKLNKESVVSEQCQGFLHGNGGKLSPDLAGKDIYAQLQVTFRLSEPVFFFISCWQHR